MALHAIEKYLKGILLFNGKSVCEIGHNLSKTLDEVKKLPAVNLSLPPEVEKFVETLVIHIHLQSCVGS
jgi:HEPN domain-containing protein